MDLPPLEKLSPYPIVNLAKIGLPVDGGILPLSNYCSKRFENGNGCRKHYEEMAKKMDGCVQCPFGMASLKFTMLGRSFAITGFIPFPRLGGDQEGLRAKENSSHKLSVASAEKAAGYFQQIQQIAQSDFEEQLKKYPVAFHELRKLNGAIKQRAEKLLTSAQESEEIRTIYSSTELMSNNLDLLEIMASKDGLLSLPLNSTINLLDLAYKCKKVYQQRAEEKNLVLWVDGIRRPIIQGNKKTFPTLLTVLVENAIKYSREGTRISITAGVNGKNVRLAVHNVADIAIDTNKCFEKGFRSPTNIEGSGLGLFIAQLVAKQHHGEIKCEQRGELKTFYLDLPLHDIM